MKKRLALLFGLLFLLALFSEAAWLTGYTYRKKITFQTTNVDADLTLFPAYVYLDPTGSGSGLAGLIQDDGDDIRFTELDGDAELVFELEPGSYSEAAGNSTGHFWVETENARFYAANPLLGDLAGVAEW